MTKAPSSESPVPKATALGTAYWRLWWANAVDSVGDGAFAAALPLLAVTLTKDPRVIAVISMVTYLPWLLVSLPAGALADRYDRATLMWRAQLVQCAVVAVIAALVAGHLVDIWALAVAGFFLGSAQVVFDNAAQSVLPSLVPPDLLPKANGTQYVVQVIGGSFVGPPVGSALFALAPVTPFGVDAASFAGSAALLSRLPRAHPDQRPPGQSSAGRGDSGISAGLRWLARHRLLRIVAVMLAVNNFSSQMGMATFVLFATQNLGVSTRGYGFLLSASAVGSVLGGLVNPALARRFGQVPLLVTASAASAVIAIGMGMAPDAVILGALMACRGFTVTLWNVVTVSLRQRVVPDELLGRVNSVYRMLGWGTIPLGALAGGFIAQLAGLRAPYTVSGILRGAMLLALVPALLAAARAQEPKKN
jgi:MFS family permease